ncbi:MAG: hypothetical protein WBQ43_21955 [Terriglobales bacterium]
MAANPNIAPQIERTFEQQTVRADDLWPVSLKQRVLDLLVEIFEGYEEFLGLTPDQSAGTWSASGTTICSGSRPPQPEDHHAPPGFEKRHRPAGDYHVYLLSFIFSRRSR